MDYHCAIHVRAQTLIQLQAAGDSGQQYLDRNTPALLSPFKGLAADNKIDESPENEADDSFVALTALPSGKNSIRTTPRTSSSQSSSAKASNNKHGSSYGIQGGTTATHSTDEDKIRKNLLDTVQWHEVFAQQVPNPFGPG